MSDTPQSITELSEDESRLIAHYRKNPRAMEAALSWLQPPMTSAELDALIGLPSCKDMPLPDVSIEDGPCDVCRREIRAVLREIVNVLALADRYPDFSDREYPGIRDRLDGKAKGLRFALKICSRRICR